jgi:hypothetical protein
MISEKINKEIKAVQIQLNQCPDLPHSNIKAEVCEHLTQFRFSLNTENTKNKIRVEGK